MPPQSPPAPDQPQWQPATFLERGVAVPFTSPPLAGARVRQRERRCDLVVPHPGGARGVYIFSLASLGEFCVPSVHDVLLAGRLLTLPSLTPASVRLTALGVAAEGSAGRAAAAAAEAAVQADRDMETACKAMLLAALARDTDVRGLAADATQRTQIAVHQLARRTGRTPEAVAADIAVLAGRLAQAGLDVPAGPHSPALPGRSRMLLKSVGAMATQVQAWGHAGGDQQAALQVAALSEAMAATGQLVLEAAHKLLLDPAALLAGWAAAPDALSARIGRPDWLLDGWEHICLLWRVSADGDARAAALAELTLLLPPIPQEAQPWFAAIPSLRSNPPVRGAACPLPRAGGRIPSQAIRLIERNERIRGLAA